MADGGWLMADGGCWWPEDQGENGARSQGRAARAGFDGREEGEAGERARLRRVGRFEDEEEDEDEDEGRRRWLLGHLARGGLLSV